MHHTILFLYRKPKFGMALHLVSYVILGRAFSTQITQLDTCSFSWPESKSNHETPCYAGHHHVQAGQETEGCVWTTDGQEICHLCG